MPTGFYRLKSAARPAQYLSLVDGKVVGHSDEPGVMNKWFVTFDERDWGVFQPVRNGEVSPEYIYFDESGSLKMAGNGMLFPVLERTGPSSESRLFSIVIDGTDLVWALLTWDKNTPVVTQTNDGSTQQLWVFEKFTV
ncbi:uncharacterized protein EDB91DRAFT_1249076 [Suillus paluster]|uniref:uncharacterized protein n=1 Tax=Suillus paluster TaxID=48578 RepID=UPI001B87B666|nr:uncharacterized protein EDB91DRAFT_1249076 [Suillus paluster]KAG1738901.1 hypothetical protein EDB91DRAFT_1249076 [Suillus paluster]